MKLRPKLFDYIVHIQNGSKVTEVCGTREDYSMKQVYQWLLGLAADMGGWLLSDQITERVDKAEIPLSDSRSTCDVIEGPPAPIDVDKENDSASLGAMGKWGLYTRRYAGASRLTFKEGS